MKPKKQAHFDGYWLTFAALNGNFVVDHGDTINVKLTFHPPTKGRRDRDNVQASMKHYLDGIAQALGVDDSRFRPVSDWGEVCKGGKVIVEVGV
jgi:crossover junction endodeoxyribonuclease RusA